MHRAVFCIMACALVYVKPSEAFGDVSTDSLHGRSVDKQRGSNDMVDELRFLINLIEEERGQQAERTVLTKANMLVLGHVASGTDSIDFAVLFVSASAGELEADIAASGLTRQHASLARKLGISQLVVAVNKMDSTVPPYSEARFSKVREEMKNLLQNVGYDPETIAIVPITSSHGDNILETSARMPWYKGWSFVRKADTITGNTLVNALDALTAQLLPKDKPLRIPLQDVYKVPGRGVRPIGCIEYGILRSGMEVKFAPGGYPYAKMVKDVEIHHELIQEAKPGDTPSFTLQGVSIREVRKGMVVGDASNDPPKEAVNFKALVSILAYPGDLTAGSTSYLFCHVTSVPCQFTTIHEKIDPVTGATLELNPLALRAGDAAIMTLTPQSPIVVEAFSEYPNLGKFSVQGRGVMVFGIIQSVVKK